MEEEAVIWKSDTDSMASVLIGRAMSTLLTCRPRKLDEAISRLDSPSKRGSIVSLEDSLWFLHRYIKEAADKEERLDEILVPMIEHTGLDLEKFERKYNAKKEHSGKGK
ncbi:hypothetical protein CK203_012325 [Vitis vinifera]|uniref:Uncharacterized protein n=1 Tax=Vitis vinifera TaxID=29760 RepID=A0A438JLH0_VITVI|nr:hypothetical protein CK203_012325 [Vitis vinifera]